MSRNTPEKEFKDVFVKGHVKTYSLLGLVKGTWPVVEAGPEDTAYSWPHLTFWLLLLTLGTTLFLMVLSYFVDAPLEEIANPAHPTNPAKAPWYFLWLQELVAIRLKLPLGGAAFWGGVVIPTVFVIFLVLLPYLDRSPLGVGVWFHPARRGITILFTIGVTVIIVLIILGYFFRGPNWQLVSPWAQY